MKKGNKLFIAGLLVLALVLINYIASSFPAKIDMTADDNYTLTEGTKNLLKKIEEPITLQFYFSRSVENLPINYKNYATRVEEMLNQYVAASKGLISLRVIDPKPDTEEEETAIAASIQPRSVPTGEVLFFGLVAIQADTEKAIPIFTPAREGFLEYDISQLIFTVQLLDKPTLGIISSLPLQSFDMAMPGQPPPRPSQMIIQEWEKTYEIIPIESNQQSIPENIDVLAVIHPRELDPKLVFAIDQFVLKGNPLFLAVDPSSRYFKRMGRQTSQYEAPDPNLTSDLPALLSGWGISYNPQSIASDRLLASRVQTEEGLVDYPVWLSFTAEQFNQEILPTNNLSSMLLIEAGVFSLAEDSELELTPLLQTSNESSRMAAMTVSYTPPHELARQLKPRGSPLTIAGLIQGNLKTAFPDGEPADETVEEKNQETTDADTETTLNKKDPLKESQNPGTILLITDTDWLFDEYSVRKLNVFNLVQPLNDNLTFGGNSLDFLGGSQDLISIRSKGNSVREFDVIKKMEMAAQERYQAEVLKLETELKEVQSRLNELSTEDDEGNRLVLSEDAEQSIQLYRAQEAVVRSQLRKIRKALREEIEHLELKLTLANLLFIPILVGIFGVWFFMRRNRMNAK
jgi:ABC-type uncharacterized transport system involved in gliding motility auxiliary subunit